MTVTKVMVNDNGGAKQVADFPLFVDGNPATSGVQNSFSAGSHTVSETNQPGYAATISGDCSANGAITDRRVVALEAPRSELASISASGTRSNAANTGITI